MAAIAYWILVRAIIRVEGRDSLLAKAIGTDKKGNVSVVIYALAIPLAYYNQWIAQGLYLVVAFMWIVPDSRIEKLVQSSARR